MISSSVSKYFCPTQIIMGVGARFALQDILKQESARKILLMVDGALLESRFFSDIKDIVTQAGASFYIFSDIEPEPSAETVHRAFEVQQSCGATLTIAVGGGSTMDAAKAVGILATSGGRINDYEGIEKFSSPPLPLIALPSTAGTGSEVSGSCVISNTQEHRKMSIRHASLNPARYAILDPDALATAPAHVIAHAGIDAFVHAFESYISRQANIFTDAVNLHAIELIHGNIRQLAADPTNKQAGLAMLCGSALAGMAFGQTGLGNVHCMARFVGAGFHLSHGLSNAICLPYVAQFNMQATPVKFARAARAMGQDTQGLTQWEAARKAVALIREMCDDLGIPPNLAAAGVDQGSLAQMADACSRAGYEKWNPRRTSRQDFQTLFERAYAGA
ncbi:MAG: iron-containing alcohol dehydrogenase [Pusillimonas sp.]